MSTLQIVLPILKEAISDIQQAQGMSNADRKSLAISLIKKLIVTSALPKQEQDILNVVLPLLVDDIEEVEADVKGCFSCLKKKLQ